MKKYILTPLTLCFATITTAQTTYSQHIDMAYRSSIAGVKYYDNKLYEKAYEEMKNIVTIHDLYKNDTIRSFKYPQIEYFDTLASLARVTMGECMYWTKRYDEAILLFKITTADPLVKSPESFRYLISSYLEKQDTASAVIAIKKGLERFPEDKQIRKYEIDQLIKEKEYNDLVKELQQECKAEPNNDVMHFNLAVAYFKIARLKTKDRSSDVTSLLQMAEEEFLIALKSAPNDTKYNFSLGAFYFDQSSDLYNDIIAIKGTTDTENKQIAKLKSTRYALFVSATPYLEHAYHLLANGSDKLNKEDAQMFKDVVITLKYLYEMQNNNALAEKMQQVYDKIK